MFLAVHATMLSETFDYLAFPTWSNIASAQRNANQSNALNEVPRINFTIVWDVNIETISKGCRDEVV